MWYESNSESILGIQCTELSTVPVRLDVFKPGVLHTIIWLHAATVKPCYSHRLIY
jgi:hypothetical protein